MTRIQPVDWYDLPRYYDILFDVDTDREADFLEAVFGMYGGRPGRRVLEPACGSGRLMEALGRRGFRVAGFDGNPHMLDYTRRRLRAAGIRGRVHSMALERFRLPHRYDHAHCLVSTFKYLQTERDARTHLQGVARALGPGGIYVVGLHLTEYDAPAGPEERWRAERDGVTVRCHTRFGPADRRRRTERVTTRLTVRHAGAVARYQTAWTFRTYDAAQLRRLLRSVTAFELVATYDFSYRLDRPRTLGTERLDAVLVLRRR